MFDTLLGKEIVDLVALSFSVKMRSWGDAKYASGVEPHENNMKLLYLRMCPDTYVMRYAFDLL